MFHDDEEQSQPNIYPTVAPFLTPWTPWCGPGPGNDGVYVLPRLPCVTGEKQPIYSTPNPEQKGRHQGHTRCVPPCHSLATPLSLLYHPCVTRPLCHSCDIPVPPQCHSRAAPARTAVSLSWPSQCCEGLFNRISREVVRPPCVHHVSTVLSAHVSTICDDML